MKLKVIVIALMILVGVISAPITLKPQTASALVASECAKGTFLGLPYWYEYLDVNEVDGSCEITGPKEAGSDNIDWQKASMYIGIAAIEILLRIATFIAIGFVIYGGFRYMTSQGEPENTKNARQTILNAVIGLVISLIATAAVAFIGNTVG